MAFNKISDGQVSKAHRKERINRKRDEKAKRIWRKNNKQQ